MAESVQYWGTNVAKDRVISRTRASSAAQAATRLGISEDRVAVAPELPMYRVQIDVGPGPGFQVSFSDNGAGATQSRKGELFDKCVDGTITGEEMIEAIKLLIRTNR
jgi:hypothetical protein